MANYTEIYSNVTKVYIWGYGYKLNNGSAIYLNDSKYSNSTVLEITSDCTITLIARLITTGGGSND